MNPRQQGHEASLRRLSGGWAGGRLVGAGSRRADGYQGRDFVRFRLASFWVAVLGVVLAPPARAQGRLADVRAGSVVERIVSAADTSEAYAVYLPSGYTPQREWPVLFVMDPRGQAVAALKLFQPAAERMGWIVVSSYNTESDVKVSPNQQALAAMLDDVQRDLSFDGRRLYLAGFSGTAREAWFFAFRLPNAVAGLLNFGAGLPDESPFLRMRAGETPRFAIFDGTGDQDFNYDEVRTLNQRLVGTPIAHRYAAYPGPHDWCPPAVCTEAVEWMELQAVKRGLAQRSAAWQDTIFAAAVARAAAREAAGDRFGAMVRYRAVVEDFGGSHDVSAAEAKATALGADRGVRDEIARSARQAVRDSATRKHNYAVFQAMADARRPPELARLLADLGTEELKREAARTDDTIASLSARRTTADLMAYTSFYGPRTYLEKHDSARAFLLLNVARSIRPTSPGMCYTFAVAYVQLGHPDAAFAELECLVKAPVDPAFLRQDRDLAPLRADPRFAALLERLRAARAAQPPAPTP
jgi:dienelactone hydrolase